MSNHKNGIALIGSTIVDELIPVVKPGQLTYVDANKFVPESELKGEKPQFSVGGMALNVAVDLAKIGGGYPIAVFGKLGRDHRAEIICKILRENRINTDTLIFTEEYETSTTEVMHMKMPDGSIERIFRHILGAMGSFNEADISYDKFSKYKIAVFGYGLLLPQLDMEDKEFGTVMGRILHRVQKSGVQTALDFVSPNQENIFKFLRYNKSIAFVDICCINEDQACSITNKNQPREACVSLVKNFGAGIAVVHCGADGPNYAYTKTDGLIVQNNFIVPDNEYKGNAGAGDAFSAGLLHGIHQKWDLRKSVKFAAAAAAISLNDVSCTGAMKDESFILNYMDRAAVLQ